MLKGKGESVFERRECSFIENFCVVGKVIEELASHINRTCQRQVKECEGKRSCGACSW